MNVEDEWITETENNDEPIIIESKDMEDDDWVEDFDDEWIDDGEEIDENNEPVTIEQMQQAIDEAKQIMLTFVKDNFDKKIYDKVLKLLDKTNIDIDRDPKNADACAAYCSYNERDFYYRKIL